MSANVFVFGLFCLPYRRLVIKNLYFFFRSFPFVPESNGGRYTIGKSESCLHARSEMGRNALFSGTSQLLWRKKKCQHHLSQVLGSLVGRRIGNSWIILNITCSIFRIDNGLPKNSKLNCEPIDNRRNQC